MKPSRFHVSARKLTDDKSKRDLRSRYEMGEYQPGKDRLLHLCEQCQLDDCIRPEGDFRSIGAWGDYPGCLIWEEAKR